VDPTLVQLILPLSDHDIPVGLARIELATSALSEQTIRSRGIPPDPEVSQYSSSDGVTEFDGETA
jgi:hypothetical protein